MDLGENAKIRLNTNGYNLEYMLDLIEMYKDRIDVMISVDSINEYVNGIHYPKYLSPKIEKLAIELVKRQISTRFNIVVTKYNYIEVECLIERALNITDTVRYYKDNYGFSDKSVEEFLYLNRNIKGEETSLYPGARGILKWISRKRKNEFFVDT